MLGADGIDCYAEVIENGQRVRHLQLISWCEGCGVCIYFNHPGPHLVFTLHNPELALLGEALS
jgi:hypothetical protein